MYQFHIFYRKICLYIYFQPLCYDVIFRSTMDQSFFENLANCGTPRIDNCAQLWKITAPTDYYSRYCFYLLVFVFFAWFATSGNYSCEVRYLLPLANILSWRALMFLPYNACLVFSTFFSAHIFVSFLISRISVVLILFRSFERFLEAGERSNCYFRSNCFVHHLSSIFSPYTWCFWAGHIFYELAFLYVCEKGIGSV